MARPRSGAFVLVSSGFLGDPEFRRLYRLCDTDEKFATAVGAWLIGLAAARRAKVRDMDFTAESGVDWVHDVLKAAGLADEVGVPESQYLKWAPVKTYPSDGATTKTTANSGNSGPLRKLQKTTKTTKTSDQISSTNEEEDEDVVDPIPHDPDAFRKAMESAGLDWLGSKRKAAS